MATTKRETCALLGKKYTTDSDVTVHMQLQCFPAHSAHSHTEEAFLGATRRQSPLHVWTQGSTAELWKGFSHQHVLQSKAPHCQTPLGRPLTVKNLAQQEKMHKSKLKISHSERCVHQS